MVLIRFPAGGDFWIDAYEASRLPGFGVIGDATLDADGDGKIADRRTAMAHARTLGVVFDEDPNRSGELDPNEANTNLTTAIAQSAPSKVPWVNVSFWQAASACANAGKRLCTGAEWVWACSGAGLNNRFAYGNTFDGGNDRGQDCWTGGGWPVALTGTARGCVTPQGLWDMSGNVDEMTDLLGKEAALRGGWVSAPGENSACGFSVNAPVTNGGSEGGFRCCRDP